MTPKDHPGGKEAGSALAPVATNPLTGPITAAVASWLAISFGFFGLKLLMKERPEFVGQPMRVTKAELVQDSPQVVTRKVADDILVIKPLQPESADVTFDMKASGLSGSAHD